MTSQVKKATREAMEREAVAAMRGSVKAMEMALARIGRLETTMKNTAWKLQRLKGFVGPDVRTDWEGSSKVVVTSIIEGLAQLLLDAAGKNLE